MADFERLLLAKAIREQDMVGLVEAKVTLDFFIDDEHRAVFTELTEHWQRYGQPMSESAFKADRPSYKLPPTPEPMAYYVDRIRQAYKHDVVGHAVQDAADLLADRETSKAIETLTAALNDVSANVSPLKDHNLTDPEAFDRLFDFYAKLTENPGALRGYATGWETLDLATMGLQAGQLVTFVGPPKAGKSTVMLAVADYINKLTSHAGMESGVDVLLVSFEMSYDEQVARWVGINGRLNYRRLLKGKMNDFDEKRLNRVLKRLKKGRAPFILSEDVSSTTTVSGIIAKVQQHRPKVLFIDGVYLMDDENGEPKGSAQAITNITRSLKRVAQVFGIPVVISTQTLLSKMRGQSIKTSSIGYSSSFGQDSDTVIAIEPRETEDGENEVWLKVLLSRSGPKVETQIEFDWNTSTFSEYAADFGSHADPDEDDDGEMRSA